MRRGRRAPDVLAAAFQASRSVAMVMGMRATSGALAVRQFMYIAP